MESNLFIFDADMNLVAERTHTAPNTTPTREFAHTPSEPGVQGSFTTTSSQDGTSTPMGTQEFLDPNTVTLSQTQRTSPVPESAEPEAKEWPVVYVEEIHLPATVADDHDACELDDTEPRLIIDPNELPAGDNTLDALLDAPPTDAQIPLPTGARRRAYPRPLMVLQSVKANPSYNPVPYYHVCDKTRAKVGINIQKGKDISEVADTFQIQPTTVRQIIQAGDATGSTNRKKRTTFKTALDSADIEDEIKLIISNRNTSTLEEILQGLKEKFDVVVSKSTLSRKIKRMGYSKVKAGISPQERNSDKTIGLRFEYSRIIFALLDSNSQSRLYFLDETGFSASMSLKYAWTKTGTPAFIIRKRVKSLNHLMCALLGPDGMVMYQMVKGGFNTERYLEFVKAILRYFEEKGITDPIIVMDNVGFHKTDVVKQILPRCTTLVGPNAPTGPSALLLPPYSPFLNPIEEVFGLLKYMVAKEKKPLSISLWSVLSRRLNSLTRKRLRPISVIWWNFSTELELKSTSTNKINFIFKF